MYLWTWDLSLLKGNTAQSSELLVLSKIYIEQHISVTSGVAEDAKFSLCCFAILISAATVDSYSDIKQVI